MSYTSTIRPIVGTRARAYRRRAPMKSSKFVKPRQLGLGDWITDLAMLGTKPAWWLLPGDNNGNDYGDELGCLASANAQVATLDNNINGLTTAWNPTGYYTADDMNKVVSIVVQQLMGAQVVILVAPAGTGDQVTVRAQAVDDIAKQYANATRFSQAATQAAATGEKINAPDLKDWVISSLMAASNGYVTAAVLGCRNDLIGTAEAAYDAVWNVLAGVAGAIVTALETVVDVAAGAFDAASFLAKYSEYLLLAGGGLAVYWFFFRGK
jgi:hypothetical protein